MVGRLDSPFSRADLEAALDASRVGIWAWDVASNQVSWTPQLERLFGFEVGSFDGSLDTYSNCVFPEDRERVFATIQTALHTREGYQFEHRVVRKSDGRLLWVECRGRGEYDAAGNPVRMTGSVLDVSARREAELQLAARDEVTMLLNDFASDYVYSSELSTLAPSIVAGSFQRVTSYTPEEVATRGGWLSVVHPEDRESISALLAEGIHRPFITEYRIVTRDGEVRWLRDHGRPQSDAAGNVLRIVGGVQDITERRHLEEQVRQSQKMEALARLAGGVAHDFNNLLTVIFSGVTLLKMSRSSERDVDALEAITVSAERAAELTRSLLALGRRQLTVARAMSLADAVAAARPLLVKPVGQVPLEIDPAASCTVRVDVGQLQLVLLNLVVNARDASQPGEAIRVVAREVEFASTSRDRPAELPPGRYGAIDVIDSGSGIASDVLPRIFEPFFTTKAPGQGTGLGLAISHGIVAQLGGALAVRSRVGQGTTFTVFLPVTTDAVTPREVDPARLVRPGGHERILLVEDEPRLRSLCARTLRDYGYSVLEAGSAEEALTLDADGVALLVSDVRMPGMDGLTLAKTLGARHPALRVLLISGYAASDDVTTDVAAGSVPFLAKPFTPEGLARRVRELLDRARVTPQE